MSLPLPTVRVERQGPVTGDYQPATLRIGPLTRLGGRISAANVAFDDHPGEKRFSDRIETVTVDSVFAWLQRAQLGGAPVVLRN